MKRCLISVALLCACGALAKGDDPSPLFDGAHWKFPKLGLEWESRKCWGPDDYDRKALPQVAPNCRGNVDDYCRKAMPNVTPNACGSVDDYCRKTCPICPGPLTAPSYSLGAPAPSVQAHCQPCLPKQH